MFVPILLGSDKTTVSVGTGNNEYWPIYLSIGNIHNNTRRAHRNGVVLLGFQAITFQRVSYHVNPAELQVRKSTAETQSFANFAGNYSTQHFP